MRWSPRVAQTFYKEWALEKLGKLVGKVRFNVQSYPTYIGEVYINGRTYIKYRGDNENDAKNAVMTGAV